MVAGCQQRLWVEERSQHLLSQPLCHRSYWCLCHLSALAQLGPQLEDRKERERVMKRKRGTKEVQTRRVKAKRKLLFYIKSDWKQSCAWGFKIKIHQRHLSTIFFFSNLNKCMSILALVTLGVCRLAWAWHHSFSRTVLALCPIHSTFHKPCQERRFLLRSLFTRLTRKVCRQKCVKGPIR